MYKSSFDSLKGFRFNFLALAIALFLILPIGLIAGDVTIAVTGDLFPKGGKYISDLILAQNPDAVLISGDTSNAGKTSVEIYRQTYKGTYDRFFEKIYPCPGNHDGYSEPPFSGYKEFWGDKAHAPEMYYSFDLGGWHIISLNSEITKIDKQGLKKQAEWLKKDLAANPGKPIIAYWHRPFFSQSGKHGGTQGGTPYMKPIWEVLMANGPALVFNGHNHIYEKYPPLDSEGKTVDESKGIQSFGIGPGTGKGRKKVKNEKEEGTEAEGADDPEAGDVKAGKKVRKRLNNPPHPLMYDDEGPFVGFFTLQDDGGFKFVIKTIENDGTAKTVDEGAGKLVMPSKPKVDSKQASPEPSLLK
ncbi:MAG TPA: metallophosphoesterase [Victivallales bacterium]|nr:metallophosphoesterase [Victivallales bacterium]